MIWDMSQWNNFIAFLLILTHILSYQDGVIVRSLFLSQLDKPIGNKFGKRNWLKISTIQIRYIKFSIQYLSQRFEGAKLGPRLLRPPWLGYCAEHKLVAIYTSCKMEVSTLPHRIKSNQQSGLRNVNLVRNKKRFFRLESCEKYSWLQGVARPGPTYPGFV